MSTAQEALMRQGILIACVALAGVAWADASFARPLGVDEGNSAELAAKHKSTQAVNFKAQVLLDRAGFSPGAIDGREGDNFANALRAFQKKSALNEIGKLDQDTWSKLALGNEPVLIEYTIHAADLKGPFAEKIPAKYDDKAKLKRLDYTSAAEMLAERFHMDQQFFEELNRGKVLFHTAIAIRVPNLNLNLMSPAHTAP